MTRVPSFELKCVCTFCDCLAVLFACTLAARAAEVEITIADGATKTLNQALTDEGKALGDADDLVKLGGGTVVFENRPGYNGNILIKDGFGFASATNAFGTGVGTTRVFAGAQLVTSNGVAKALNFPDENFILEGTGPDGMGAMRCLSNVAQHSGPKSLGKNISLSGDALITTSKEHDFHGLVNLGGHTLTVRGNFFWEDAVVTNGNVVQSTGLCVFPTQCSFKGGPSCVYTLTNNAVFGFCWSVLDKADWTLDVQEGTLNLYNDGQDNRWNGPVILRRPTSCTGNGGGTYPYNTVRFPKKVTGPGGFRMNGTRQELRLGSSENDFAGGITMKGGRLRVDAPGAVPRDGGKLYLTNTIVYFANVASNDFPSVEFSGTGRVEKCRGTWKESVVKTGAGELEYASLLTADLLDVRGGSVRFSPKALAGLNAGTKVYSDTPSTQAAFQNTDLLVTNSVESRLSMMEKSGWAANVLVSYDGYIWNTNTTDVTWTWHCCIDDACDVWLDGARVIQQSGWTKIVTTNLTLTPGPHRFIVRAYNGGGGSGASNANGAWVNSGGVNCNTKGLVVDREARGEKNNADYYSALVDPGDGSLFTVDVALRLFTTMKFASGTDLKLSGMRCETANLEGLPTVGAGTLVVNERWTLDGAAVKAGGCLAAAGKVVFGAGAQVDVSDVQWGTAGNLGYTILTAAEGIEGMPTLAATPSRYNRALKKSADGKSLVFKAASGLAILIR